MSVENIRDSFYIRYGKRAFDAVTATLGVAVLFPFLLVTAIAVKLDDPGSALFSQVRVGQFGRKFRMFKFRSMRGGGGAGSKLTPAGDPRITRLGKWLRKTKIDELPQLLNVVLGDMSIVGPRPEVPEFVRHYNEAQRGVLNARPGITGPSANVYEEELLASQEDKERFYLHSVMPGKLEIDLRYVQTISFRGDMRTLFHTIKKLLVRLYELSTRTSHSFHANYRNSSEP